jgi:hypothetical protein
MMQKRAGENGNILFLILIAVALFTALMFAVSQTSRQGGSNINSEIVRIGTSQLTQHSVDLERAVLRLRISKKLDEDVLSFDNTYISGYDNPRCTEEVCKVFSPIGGQISYIPPNRTWLDPAQVGNPHFGVWLFTATSCVPGMGKGSANDCDGDVQNTELIAFMPWVTRDVCADLNFKLGVTAANAAPPQLIGSAWAASPEFVGTYSAGQVIIDSGNILYGQAEACFEGNGTPPAGTYHYYRVLMPR